MTLTTCDKHIYIGAGGCPFCLKEQLAQVRRNERKRCAEAVCFLCRDTGDAKKAKQHDGIWMHQLHPPLNDLHVECEAATIWNLEDE